MWLSRPAALYAFAVTSLVEAGGDIEAAMAYYTKRGYRIIETMDATLNQGSRSVVMSKPMGDLHLERLPNSSY